MLGEGERRKSRIAVLLGTGRKLRPVQRLVLGAVETEHEIFGKALGVALDPLVQPLGADSVEGGEIGIEDDALAAQDEDCAGDVLDRRKDHGFRHRGLPVGLRRAAVERLLRDAQ